MEFKEEQIDKKDKGRIILLILGIILIVVALFFLNSYFSLFRINDPDSLDSVLKTHGLQDEAKKKVQAKRINVVFFNDNEKFKDLKEIEIKIKELSEIKTGKDNPFRSSKIEEAEQIEEIEKNDESTFLEVD